MIQFDHNLNIYSQQDPKLRNNHSQNMFNHIKLAKKPKQFLSITGLTVTQFDSLSKEIQKHYKITEAKCLSKNRERKIGAGHKFDHPLKDRIIMLLMYYRMYTTYDLLGMIFDLDKSNVMRDIKYLEYAVKKSIPIPTKKYADSKKLKSLDDIQQFFPELIAITDGTEQLNQRAIKVLESNQILHKYTQLKKGGKKFVNKAIRINQNGKPFTVSDFPEIKKSVRKKYVFELRKIGIIETLEVSGYAYYRVIGFRLDNFWEKVTKNPTGVIIEDKTLQEEIFEVLEEYLEELDAPALHNIRLHLYDDFMYEIIKRRYEKEKPYNIEYNEINKSFTIVLPIFGFENFEVKIILTPTKLIQILIKNTFKPIVYDEMGLMTLVLFLGEMILFV